MAWTTEASYHLNKLRNSQKDPLINVPRGWWKRCCQWSKLLENSCYPMWSTQDLTAMIKEINNTVLFLISYCSGWACPVVSGKLFFQTGNGFWCSTHNVLILGPGYHPALPQNVPTPFRIFLLLEFLLYQPFSYRDQFLSDLDDNTDLFKKEGTHIWYGIIYHLLVFPTVISRSKWGVLHWAFVK